MKSTQKKELFSKSLAELISQLKEAEINVAKTRIEVVTGKQKSGQLVEMKKKIAILNTIIAEKKFAQALNLKKESK